MLLKFLLKLTLRHFFKKIDILKLDDLDKLPFWFWSSERIFVQLPNWQKHDVLSILF